MLCLAAMQVKSNTALGMPVCLRRNGIGSRSSSKERDAETGLDFFGARYYSGAQGRFTSPDPLYIEYRRLRDPQQLNLYGYVRNNPLRFTDPTGLYLFCEGTESSCGAYMGMLQKKLGYGISLSGSGTHWQITTSALDDQTIAALSPAEREIYNIIMSPIKSVLMKIVEPIAVPGLFFGASELGSFQNGRPGVHTISLGQGALLNNSQVYTDSQLTGHETLEAVYEVLGLSFKDAHKQTSAEPGFEGIFDMGGLTYSLNYQTMNVESITSLWGIAGSADAMKVVSKFVTPVPIGEFKNKVGAPWPAYPIKVEKNP
jgi:RHS repeat-associated protein